MYVDRPLQREIINATLQGTDVLCLMPTGLKYIKYLCPSCHATLTCIVIRQCTILMGHVVVQVAARACVTSCQHSSVRA